MIKFVKTYFWEVLRFQYWDFKGRASRKQYLYFSLIWLSINTLLFFISQEEDISTDLIIATFPVLIICFLLNLPQLAISVRRLHDANLSGWWYLLWLFVAGICCWILQIQFPLLIKGILQDILHPTLVIVILSCLPSIEFNKKENPKAEKMGERSVGI
jgi:uncharacterized membrane protein YhaH (DUF805 family)